MCQNIFALTGDYPENEFYQTNNTLALKLTKKDWLRDVCDLRAGWRMNNIYPQLPITIVTDQQKWE